MACLRARFSHRDAARCGARGWQESRETFAGTAVLLFQPAEEGPGGAQPMIDEGALDDPRVEAVTMLHIDPRLETGQHRHHAGGR